MELNFVIVCIAVTVVIAGFTLFFIQKRGYRVRPLGVGSFFLICMPVVMGIGGIGRLELGVYGVFVAAIIVGVFLIKAGFKKN